MSDTSYRGCGWKDKCFIYFKKFLLECSWLQCSASFRCRAKWIIYVYIYPLFFSIFSNTGHHRVLSSVLLWSFNEQEPCGTESTIRKCVIYSRSLLVTYFIYSSAYVSISSSQFIPSPTLLPGNHKFVFYTGNSISVLCW